jgi:hypothetical protein
MFNKLQCSFVIKRIPAATKRALFTMWHSFHVKKWSCTSASLSTTTWRHMKEWIIFPALYGSRSPSQCSEDKKTKLHGLSLRANYINPSDRCLSTKLVPTFADRGCHVVRGSDPYGRILGFLDRIHYFFFQVASQLYSRGWVDPVPDPLLLGKSGSVGNGTVYFLLHNVYKFCSYLTGNTIHPRSVARNSYH